MASWYTDTWATVKMLVQWQQLLQKKKQNKKWITTFLNNKIHRHLLMDLLAVHMANNICIESKKKNMTRSDTEAPKGRQRACIVSNVCTSKRNTLWKLFASNRNRKLKFKRKIQYILLSQLDPPSFGEFSFSFNFASCSIFNDLQ